MTEYQPYFTFFSHEDVSVATISDNDCTGCILKMMRE